MDSGMKKAFQVKVKSLVRTLKQYKNYRTQLQAYDMNVVSQDKKQFEFYQESKSALDSVQKKLIEYFQSLLSYIQDNQVLIEAQEAVQQDYTLAKGQINQIKALFPAI